MARLLDRLQAANMSKQGVKTWAQRVCEQIEATFADQQSQITAIATAQAAADAAQTTANTVKLDNAISSSRTSPGTILTATDAGANASIIISNHTRKYDDGLNRSITGATLTGLSYSTDYYVYYDNSARSAGAQTYHATTNADTALSNTVTGRTFCGKITTPAAAGADTTGGVDPPSGGGGVFHGEVP